MYVYIKSIKKYFFCRERPTEFYVIPVLQYEICSRAITIYSVRV